MCPGQLGGKVDKQIQLKGRSESVPSHRRHGHVGRKHEEIQQTPIRPDTQSQ